MPMILGANANALGAHVGEWRHPDAWDRPVMNRANAVRYAQAAERGRFDLLFLADGNGVRFHPERTEVFAATVPSDRPAVFEPVTLLSALAMVTEHIGLVATATTTYEQPFTVARKFASLDHLSGGRAGWNLVTTSNEDDALNFGFDRHMARDRRYDRAAEFADVVKGLWDSWADDAFPQDKAAGRFLDPAGMHVLNHAGPHFTVRGPLNAARPPQGHPVIFSAGQSEAGKEVSARHADCVFAIASTLQQAQALYADLKGRLPKYGRGASDLKILHGVTVFVGETEAEADRLFAELEALVSPAVGVEYLAKMLGTSLRGLPLDGPVPTPAGDAVGGTAIGKGIVQAAREEGLTIRQAYKRVLPQMGGNSIKGNPVQVAEAMEAWFRGGACDGFMVAAPVVPTGLERFTELVVPELRRRGLVDAEYRGSTLRENLGLRPVPNRFFAGRRAAAE